MKIPNFLNSRVVDKDGYFTEPWKHLFEQLFQELQTQMSDEGHIAPSQPTSNILLLDDPQYIGGFLYDSDIKKAKVNIDGTYKEIVTL